MFFICSHSQLGSTFIYSGIQVCESHLTDGGAGIFSVMPRDAGRLEIGGRNCVHDDDPLVCLDHPAVPSHRDCCQHVVTLEKIYKIRRRGARFSLEL